MVGNPRKPSIFDKDPREAQRQAAQLRGIDELARQGLHAIQQRDALYQILGEMLAQQRETNRLLALTYHAQTGQPVPPPQ